MTASRTSWLKRLVYMWVAAALVLVVLVGEAGAQPKSGERATQPKKILFLHSFSQNFEQPVAWSREIRRELRQTSRWPLDIQEHSLSALDSDNAAEAKFAENLAVLYAERPPDYHRDQCARGSLRPATQDRPVPDNADAARGGRTAPRTELN